MKDIFYYIPLKKILFFGCSSVTYSQLEIDRGHEKNFFLFFLPAKIWFMPNQTEHILIENIPPFCALAQKPAFNISFFNSFDRYGLTCKDMVKILQIGLHLLKTLAPKISLSTIWVVCSRRDFRMVEISGNKQVLTSNEYHNG